MQVLLQYMDEIIGKLVVTFSAIQNFHGGSLQTFLDIARYLFPCSGIFILCHKFPSQLQSFTKYLRQTPVFM